MSEDVLFNREMGQVQLSIATSLALEGAFGIFPDREEKPPPILKYTRLWVNVSTMFRNLFTSLTSDEQARVTAKEIAPILASEMSILEGEVMNVTGRKLKVTFFYNDLSNLAKTMPHANVKIPTTDKQRIYSAIHNDAIRSMADMLDEVDYRIFAGKISGDGNALMITHSPVDLLSFNRFDELTLLESHTGKLKKRAVWGSKLGIKDETMPFNEFTMTVFGDQSTHLSPLPIKYRRVITELAKKNRWTPLTTLPKIRMDLATVKDVQLKEHLFKILADRSF